MQIKKMKRKEVRCIVELVGDGSVIKHYDETTINLKLQHYYLHHIQMIILPLHHMMHWQI